MIISQDGVKRKLADKPYLLMLSRAEARTLCEQLEKATRDEFSFGVVTIYPFSWCDSPNNSEPVPWTQK